MQRPQRAEEYITIVDNKGRERIQRVEYVVSDVRDETVYVTVDGLIYARDSLARKAHYYLIDEFIAFQTFWPSRTSWFMTMPVRTTR